MDTIEEYTTHRYALIMNINWRNDRLFKVAEETFRIMNRKSSISLIVAVAVGMLLTAILQFLFQNFYSLNHVSVFCLSFLGVIVVNTLGANLIFALKCKHRCNVIVNGINNITGWDGPMNWGDFCKELYKCYEGNKSSANEILFLIIQNPSTIEITYHPNGNTLKISYACKPNGTRNVLIDKEEFFSVFDGKNADIKLIEEEK